MGPITAATTNRMPQSAPTSAGTTSTLDPNATSPSTPKSGNLITYRRLLDTALATPAAPAAFTSVPSAKVIEKVLCDNPYHILGELAD